MFGEDSLCASEIVVVDYPQLGLTLEKWDISQRPGELLVLCKAGDARALEQAAHKTDFAHRGAAHQTFHSLWAKPVQKRCRVLVRLQHLDEC